MATRSSTEHSIFGNPQPLSKSQLPTSADVFRAYDYQLKYGECSSVRGRSSLIGKEVKEIYDIAGIPTIEINSVVKRVERLVAKVKELNKYSTSKKSSTTFEETYQSLQSLFDICCCKCFDYGALERSACTCPLSMKIPGLEWNFWADQKTTRKMYIGKIDKEITMKLQKKVDRSKRQKSTETTNDVEMDNELNLCRCDSSDVSGMHDDYDNYDNDDVVRSVDMMTCSDEKMKAVRNTLQYSELCRSLDRCKVSNRDACLIVNSVLKDLNLLTAESCVDPAKLRRQRKVWRQKEINRHSNDVRQLKCMGFDGKQDVTLVRTGTGCNKRSIKEEHYVVVSYPGGQYVDHVVPDSSKSSDIAKELLSIIIDTKSMETLSAIVCDGTVINTGKSNGVIPEVERHVGRPLQWLICLLHTNELPLRKYISVIDGGRTTGPSTSTGKILSSLDFDPKDLPLTNFKTVPGKVVDIADDVKKDLSTDQSYLLRSCLAVQNGINGTENKQFLQNCMPGNLNHARWTTTANRILRLYMSSSNCTSSLYRIVRFIVNVYAPSWFHIKLHSECYDGAQNFFHLMKLCFELGPDDWAIVKPVLQNNAYFAHPENILLAGILDENQSVRKIAHGKIVHARIHSQINIRLFDKLSIDLNPSASSYMDMISWDTTTVTPPPLLSMVSNDDLDNFSALSVRGILCHSQPVERVVRDLSATTSRVIGHTARHGMVLQCKRSRYHLPSVVSKSSFL